MQPLLQARTAFVPPQMRRAVNDNVKVKVNVNVNVIVVVVAAAIYANSMPVFCSIRPHSVPAGIYLLARAQAPSQAKLTTNISWRLAHQQVRNGRLKVPPAFMIGRRHAAFQPHSNHSVSRCVVLFAAASHFKITLTKCADQLGIPFAAAAAA